MEKLTDEQVKIFVVNRLIQRSVPAEQANQMYDSWLSVHDDAVAEQAVEDHKTNEAWQEYGYFR